MTDEIDNDIAEEQMESEDVQGSEVAARLDAQPESDDMSVDQIESEDVQEAEVTAGESEDDDDEPLISQTEQEVAESALEEVASTVEAILFATSSPLNASKLGSIAEIPTRSVKRAIAVLNERYAESGCAFRIEEIAGGYQLMSLPEYNDVLKRMLNVKKETRLSQAAMETLAIVAYRQPILRADIESIRGVACGEVLRSLMERQLIKIVGRAEVIGRPMLYGTTKRFLEIFGLGSLEDLPRAEELRQPAENPKKAKPKDEQPDDDSNDETVDEENEINGIEPQDDNDNEIVEDDIVDEEFDDDEDDEFNEDDEFDEEDEDDDFDDEFDDDDEDDEDDEE